MAVRSIKRHPRHPFFGKVLRIDVAGGGTTYAVPPSNPFVGMPNVGYTRYLPEIFLMGFRNPWRFSFDRLTGDLYIGDVGDTGYEEIDFHESGSPGGDNYGWPYLEGRSVRKPLSGTNSLLAPISGYAHAKPDWGVNCIIGGYVYRGHLQPRMEGLYISGDFMSGTLSGLKRVGTNWQRVDLPRAGEQALSMTAFGEDEEGELYLADNRGGLIYRIEDSQEVWKPVFSPPGPIINTDQAVVSCVSKDAVIHYTTNGAEPTETDPVVPANGVIPVSNHATSKARAFRTGLTPSAVASSVYTFRVGTPIFSPTQGPIADNTEITISTPTPGAAIYYAIDGFPNEDSLIYSRPLILSGGVTVRAYGTAPGYLESQLGSAAYTRASAAVPLFMPPSGPITNGTLLSISSATPGAAIYYTLDGAVPTTNSLRYSGPFPVNGGVTVNAFATADGYTPSPARNTFYALVSTMPPVFTPSPGTIAFGSLLSIACATPGAKIFYTVDGSLPTTNSLKYSEPLVMQSNITLNAFAIAPEHLASSVQLALYTLPKLEAPNFSPGFLLTNGAWISITPASPNATIHYTIDGSDPDTNAPVFEAPLRFQSPITVRAQAYAQGFNPSDVHSAFFGLLDPGDSVVTTLAGGLEAGFRDGPANLARFATPTAVCIDPGGNLYVADSGNNRIRKISTAGEVTTVAGSGVAGSQLGIGTNAQFNTPTGICISPDGTLYVAEQSTQNRICAIQTNGAVTVRYAGYPIPGFWQLTIDRSQNIYAGYSAMVVRIEPNGSVTPWAGTGSIGPGWGFNVGLALDAAGNLYSATAGYLWKTAPNLSTELFSGGPGAFSDGFRTVAGFGYLRAVTLDDSGTLFLSDSSRVRKIAASGWVSTVAGDGVAGYRNGLGITAEFRDAAGLWLDARGNIFVADSGNNCIRKISPDSAGIGIPDDWQQAHFGRVGIDPNGDLDHDGMSNDAEFWAGTDPLDASSLLAIDHISAVSGGHTSIQWRSAAGRGYTVKYSTDLRSWTVLGKIEAGGSDSSMIDSAPIGTVPQRFYRVFLNP